MKKTSVRIVAILVLAVMLFSCIPAFAISGTVANRTAMYEKAKTSSDIVAYITGPVTIHYQNNDGTMYQVSIVNNGTTYTGWVPASSVSGITSGSTSGSTNVGSSSSSSSNVGSSSSSSSTSNATYTATVANNTGLYDASNKLIGTIRTGGKVSVTQRDASGSMVFITVTSGGSSYSGWVSANALYNLSKSGKGSIKVSDLPTSSAGVSSSGAVYSPYPKAQLGTSQDSTIYMRKTASSSTSSSNVVQKVRDAKGSTFTILGESGDWYYASYGGYQGFVRKKDFTLSAGTVGSTNTNTNTNTNTGSNAPATTYSKAQTATSNDSTIYMRVKPDKSTAKENVVVKVSSARGQNFSLLGESGDWYYAQYGSYKGYVRKQDFSIVDPSSTTSGVTTSTSTSGAASVGKGSSSEAWGTFTVPGMDTYKIYGNYTNAKGNLYYYDYSNIKSYKYLHSTTAKGSQVACIMGHNMRESRTMFHNLHHIQNAILGKSSCEGCGRSISSSFKTTQLNVNWDGHTKWNIMCFYETPHKMSGGTTLLTNNARPWTTSTQNYVNTQLSYAKSGSYKGWVNPSVSYSANGAYMMLITCGDKYESGSSATSKLNMLLKAAN